MIKVIEKMLNRYMLEKREDYINVLREILQELALLGLWRGKFFEKAAFYGGTALRILYDIDRFSEDIDFSLLEPTLNFKLEKYIRFVNTEISSFGIKTKIDMSDKNLETPIQTAILRTDIRNLLYLANVENNIINQFPKNQIIKIKIEIDTNPATGFLTETKYLLQPIPFSVKLYSLPDLFASKMHAILCRKWKNRVKGRDWYDFVWYVSNYPKLHLKYLEAKMKQTGDLNKNDKLDRTSFISILNNAINRLDVKQAREDVEKFIRRPEELLVWSRNFFISLTEKIVLI